MKIIKCNFQTFCISLYFCVPLISAIVIETCGLAIMPQLYIALSMVLCISFISSKGKISNSGFFWILVIYIFCSYTVTEVLYGDQSTIDFNLLVTGCLIPILFAALFDIKIKTLIDTFILISATATFFIGNLLIPDSNNMIGMGISYALMPGILASVVYCLNFSGKKYHGILKIIISIAIALNLYNLSVILQYGSRGVIISVLTCAFSFFLIYHEKHSIRINKRVIIIIALLMLVVISWREIFFCILEISNFLNIKLQIIDKSIRLYEAGSISNGRDAILSLAIDGILDKPLMGHGMGMFFENTGYVYPHNFAIQMLYDGGVFLFSMMMICIFISIYHYFSNANNDDYIKLIFFSSCSIPGGMLSGDLWTSPFLWYFFSFLFCRCKICLH